MDAKRIIELAHGLVDQVADALILRDQSALKQAKKREAEIIAIAKEEEQANERKY